MARINSGEENCDMLEGEWKDAQASDVWLRQRMESVIVTSGASGCLKSGLLGREHGDE